MEAKKKYYSVMLFYQAKDMDIPFPEAVPGGDDWCFYGSRRYKNKFEALDYYANTPCPASQLIEADTLEELRAKEEQMKLNYQNPEWLEVNLYPFI